MNLIFYAGLKGLEGGLRGKVLNTKICQDGIFKSSCYYLLLQMGTEIPILGDPKGWVTTKISLLTKITGVTRWKEPYTDVNQSDHDKKQKETICSRQFGDPY